MTTVNIQLLGQSGCRLEFESAVIYFDPYLSNSVEELESPDIKRLVPIPMPPESVIDADWVLISHDHLDHCDPYTLPLIAKSSPKCRFMGPPRVLSKLIDWGVPKKRCIMALENWISLGGNINVISVPASHPTIERDYLGHLHYLGYVLEVNNKRLYLAGDTNVGDELLSLLSELTPISAAFLPVNEHNYFRGRRGIVGNMSVREAFLLAEELQIRSVIPVHWDMFAINSVSPEEISFVYDYLSPCFELNMQPDQLEL